MSRTQYAADGTAVAEVPGEGNARWSIALGVAVLVGFAGLSVASLTGSPIADDGPGMHFALALTLVSAIAVAMFAFAQAVAAKVQHQTSVLLWLPLLALPALVVYVALSSRF